MTTFSSLTTDSNGIQHLLGAQVVDFQFVDVTKSRFYAPDSDYTGYGANGFYYTAGALDPGFVQYKALWAVEGESAASINRGDRDAFPNRIFVVTTTEDVVILNADDLTVWMRFRKDVTSFGTGYLIGDSSTTLYGARFVSGWLVVATSNGLRMADFRRDICYYFGATGTGQRSYSPTDPTSGGGVSNRNTDGIVDQVAGAGGSGGKTVLAAACTGLSVGTIGTTLVAAIHHVRGFTGVLINSTAVTIPQLTEHDWVATFGAWDASEEPPGSYEYIRMTASANFTSNGVRAGDTAPADGQVIVDVDDENDVLQVEDLGAPDSDSSLDIYRPVYASAISAEGKLYLTSGSTVLELEGSGWYTGSAVDGFDQNLNRVNLGSSVTRVYDLALVGDDVFLATDRGVFRTTDDDFQPSSENYVWLYSTGNETALYTLLTVTDRIVAVAVDPETASLLILGTEGSSSRLTEMSLIENRVLRTFTETELGGAATVLFAYENPNGPPDREV